MLCKESIELEIQKAKKANFAQNDGILQIYSYTPVLDGQKTMYTVKIYIRTTSQPKGKKILF